MIQKMTSTFFNAAVVLMATAVAVFLTIAGHISLIGGLLLGMAILGAVMFGFQVAEGLESDQLSTWPEPRGSIRSTDGNAR